MTVATFTSPATGQDIEASIQPGRNPDEQVIICSWEMTPDGAKHQESAMWIKGKGWEDDTLGAWSPILEELFNLKI